MESRALKDSIASRRTDLAQEGSAARAGGPGQISRFVVHAQPGEECEGGGFDGLVGPAEGFAGGDFCFGKERRDARDEEWIESAATCEDDSFRRGQKMVLVIESERTRGEFGESGENVVVARLFEIAHRGFEERFAEKFATGTFGRFEREIFML